MAIVIPDSILTNSSTEYVREFIKRKTRILGVVSLPNGTFRQAGVNPHSSVLFLQKLDEDGLKEAKDSNYGIFMASVSELGYELDKKTAKPKYERDDSGTIIKDENGNPILDSDIPEVLEKFEDFKNSEGTEF